jgi:hypothetical protein
VLLLGLFFGLNNSPLFTLSCSHLVCSSFLWNEKFSSFKPSESLCGGYVGHYFHIIVMVVLHRSCNRLAPFLGFPPGFLWWRIHSRLGSLYPWRCSLVEELKYLNFFDRRIDLLFFLGPNSRFRNPPLSTYRSLIITRLSNPRDPMASQSLTSTRTYRSPPYREITTRNVNKWNLQPPNPDVPILRCTRVG